MQLIKPFYMFYIFKQNTFATSEDANVYLEMKTSLNTEIKIVEGNLLEMEEDYVKIQTIFKNNQFISLLQGPFSDENISISFLIETLQFNGETSIDRKFAFRLSKFYGDEHVPFVNIQLINSSKICIKDFFF
jgi:hypothetical protein